MSVLEGKVGVTCASETSYGRGDPHGLDTSGDAEIALE